ncbi:MAG: FmdB family zinc ribbon protein [Actinomycetota bacterium]|nr:FmdB family zinc ribbon protein [Actinomycetota bacterium]MEC9058645.1 FmdB family zinc ribbon protein [Actinomycetota bacterium]MEC9473908.1 FmdB family zinc ribbon protein [Actinomycetota bacterium]MEE3256095.1 FmdB family zinc ribbon protein [Actinomycetota bacterium]
MYSYHCHKCDETFDKRRPMSESGEPATCPSGHEGAERRLTTFASVGRSVPSTGAGDASSWTGRDACCGGGCHSH